MGCRCVLVYYLNICSIISTTLLWPEGGVRRCCMESEWGYLPLFVPVYMYGLCIWIFSAQLPQRGYVIDISLLNRVVPHIKSVTGEFVVMVMSTVSLGATGRGGVPGVAGSILNVRSARQQMISMWRLKGSQPTCKVVVGDSKVYLPNMETSCFLGSLFERWWEIEKISADPGSWEGHDEDQK